MKGLAAACTVLLLLLGAACGGAAEQSSDDTSSEIETAAPEAESTDGTEEGDTSGNNAVAVELPGLPVGGPSTVVSEELQCAEVTWSGPPALPQGWGVTVTGVGFDPAGDFALARADCPGDSPPCLASGVRLTADGGCHVAVTWTAPNTEGGQMSFTSGVVICPAGLAAECQGFRGEVEGEGLQSIPLEPAPVTEGEGSEGEESGSPGESTDPEESSPEAPSSEDTGDPGSSDDGGG